MPSAARTLHIVTDGTRLAGLEYLRSLFPDLEVSGRSITVPLVTGTPEEALAACVACRVPVVGSWMDQRG